MPARATPQPPSQPAQGPKARRDQVNVVPQSGMALFSSRKEYAMNRTGMNPRSRTRGV